MKKNHKFEEEYARLNPKQKEAVDTIEGPVMVIAGPGTGKTTILTLRIANILHLTDTPASGILALTFTEAGAKAMRQKLRATIGERALEVRIQTFHGFAASVINEFQDHFPHLANAKQITDIEAEVLLREILKNKKFSKLRPLGEPDFYLDKILGTIGEAKSEAWTPEMIADFAKQEIERLKNDPESVSSRGASKGSLKADIQKRIEKCERTLLFAEVYREYEARKKAERKIDFDDLLFELLLGLRQDELLRQMLQEKFLYLLVDEHQDTNDAQNLIVRSLADFFENPNLFVVGDEKQAIYRFQGASVENFLRFQKIWGGMKIISLEDNYRSHQHILDATFGMIEQNYGPEEYLNLRVKLKANKETREDKPIKIALAPDIETEKSYLVQNLRETAAQNPDDNVAVIVRTNADVSNILALLEANGIEASAERGANIFSHPVGTLFFALIEFLNDPSKIESLSVTIAGGLWGLDFKKQSELIKALRSGKIDEAEESLPDLRVLHSERNRSGPLEYLSLAADLSKLSELAGQTPLGAEVWRGIYKLAAEIAKTGGIESPSVLFQALLDYQKSAERRTVKVRTGKTDAKITVMTAHGAKGLEFDHVFLPYATEESWIRKTRGSFFVLPREKEEGDDIRDDRRLFYVALTRARKQIIISHSQTDEAIKLFEPLRFLEELDPAHVFKISLPTSESHRHHTNLTDKQNLLAIEKQEYAKRALLENGLSVTALNHFLKCPSEFFYKSVLKLPEPPNPNSEKGNAMHEALSNVWKNPTRTSSRPPLGRGGKEEIERIIKSTVTEYFKNSLLAKFEKEIVLEELLSNAPVVAAALVDHFAQEGSISTETWVEAPFEYEYKHDKIEIRLHGKLDALIEREDKLLVFDYKTREAMSENAIRGLTKDSTGDYFRQLVFYKILLSGNPKYADKKVEPALVFVKPGKGRLGSPKRGGGDCPTITLPIGESDVEKVKSEIQSLLDSVWSGDFLYHSCP